MVSGWRWGVAAAAALGVVAGVVAWAPWKAPSSDVEVEIENVEFAPPKPSRAFDGANAHKYLADICKLGPRLTASRPMQRQQEILKEHFAALGVAVEFQRFQARQGSRPEPFECVNLLVRFHPERKKRVLLGCHYDTRPMADREPPFSPRRGQFLGANDGASGVGFLMELGRLLPNLETHVGVDVVFFDAEEYIYDAQRDVYFIGSEHFVKKLLEENAKDRYSAVLVLDMIAGKKMTLHPEIESSIRSGALCQEVWGIAEELKIAEFDARPKHQVRDDHEPFLLAGINAAVIVDFDYPHWHRLSDTPQNCSPESLSKVAAVIVEWLKRRR